MQKIQFMFIISLVFAIIVTIFALTNANPVVINLIFYKFVSSQALIIFISAALGAIIVTSLGLIKHIKLKSKIKALHRENEELSTKLQKLLDETNTNKMQKHEFDSSSIEEEIGAIHND